MYTADASSAQTGPHLPSFLAPLYEALSSGPVDAGASRFVRSPAREATVGQASPVSPVRAGPTAAGASTGPSDLAEVRESAVLILVAGSTLENAHVFIEERSHSMRSQPAQFALPGGRVDPEDPSHVAAALREAREEIGLDPASHPAHRDLTVLGAFEPVRMPARPMSVTPVVAHLGSGAHEIAASLTPSPHEVERVVIAPLVGPGSLTDPEVLTFASVREQRVGIAFDLPLEPTTDSDDAFVWGFTAALLGGFLTHVIPSFEGPSSPRVKQVPRTRLQGERRSEAR